MKIYLHYNIWNKGAHVPWICDGIRTSMPENTFIDFVFENCTDDSERNGRLAFESSHYGGLMRYKHKIYTSTKKYRWPNCNDAMRRFLKSDCDLFLSPQDDQQIQDKLLVKNLEKIYSEVDKIGLLGMRDGIDSLSNYFSSNFSKGTPKTTWLKSGEYNKARHVNDGPIALTKEVIERVGFFDENYWAHYADRDYSYRCENAHYSNYVMGAEIVHEKWSCKVCGEVQASEVWSQEFSEHDYNVFRTKWPNFL